MSLAVDAAKYKKDFMRNIEITKVTAGWQTTKKKMTLLSIKSLRVVVAKQYFLSRPQRPTDLPIHPGVRCISHLPRFVISRSVKPIRYCSHCT